MLDKLYDFIVGLFVRKPVFLVIVRRYQDANRNNVGELYLEHIQNGKLVYRMIGVSLDSFSLDLVGLYQGADTWLDTRHDFLDPLPPATVRVGALDPKDNDAVRKMVARLPQRALRVIVQNRFIEHVLGAKP
jgi:hypothetical protein